MVSTPIPCTHFVVNDGFESRRLAFEKARARVATPTDFRAEYRGLSWNIILGYILARLLFVLIFEI
jgi:hypothetical protein